MFRQQVQRLMSSVGNDVSRSHVSEQSARLDAIHRSLPHMQGRLKRLALGVLFSSGVALLAYRRRSLNASGAVGAVVAGTTTVGMGGWSWGLTLIYFFVSSSLLSHFRERDKEITAADKFSKGSQRDIGQVMANGGLAIVLALCHGFTTAPRLRALLHAAYTGVLATANADTWATELGVLSSQQPHLITTGQPTSPGTSGGVTGLGTTASALGALSLGCVFWLLEGAKPAHRLLPLLSLFAGLAGSTADSLIGATIQAMYYCPVCQKETERRVHRCGTQTQPLRGIPWFDNDLVNFVSTAIGGLIACGLMLPFLKSKEHPV